MRRPIWRWTDDPQELGGEVGALDEVEDLGVDSIVGIAEFGAARPSKMSLCVSSYPSHSHCQLGGGSPNGQAEGVEDWLNVDYSKQVMLMNERQSRF